MIRCVLWFLLCFSTAFSTIAEKKALLANRKSDLSEEIEMTLTDYNETEEAINLQLKKLYAEAELLRERGAGERDYMPLLKEINLLKEEKQAVEDHWISLNRSLHQKEGSYGLWNQPETTLGTLIFDYGSQNQIYLIPPNIAAMRLSVSSELPIPYASWEELIELILNQNGVGIKELNPFLRELYLLKENRSGIRIITNNRADLSFYPDSARIAFVLSPEPVDFRRFFLFLDKFVNPNNTVLQAIGRDIFIIGEISEIKDLLKLYDFIASHKGDKEYKVFRLKRIDAKEMAAVLKAMFEQFSEKVVERTQPKEKLKIESIGDDRSDRDKHEGSGLRIVTLEKIAESLFLIGTREEIERAEEIIRAVESQIGEATENVIFTYKVQHSDPVTLSDIAQKIYTLMIASGISIPERVLLPMPGGPPMPMRHLEDEGHRFYETNEGPSVIKEVPPPERPYWDTFYQNGAFTINPAPIAPGIIVRSNPNEGKNNFIVDEKSGVIVMVVRADLLTQIKDLLKKLDVPKKMVQLDVLLFEKRADQELEYGLNILRFGTCASNTNRACISWNEHLEAIPATGIFDFIFSKPIKSHFPAYDLIYRFLLTQVDIRLHANPSVITVNQTPATIAIKEEISLKTGVFEVETNRGITLKDSWTRAQYGITIVITPTIHMSEGDSLLPQGADYVTMDTDVTFDTYAPGGDPQQPDVIRRQVINQVSIPDGQSVIIGGLLRKDSFDTKDSIPFLGEIPGIGKLFSTSRLTDTNVEMFFLITPTIVREPECDLLRIRTYELCRRPGDIPEYLSQLYAAQECEKNRVLKGWMLFLFGEPCPRCLKPLNECVCIPKTFCPPCYPTTPTNFCSSRGGEYDGRP